MEMKSHLLLSWTVALVVSGPVWAHPITDSAEMPYSGPVEDGEAVNLEEMSAEQAGPGQRYPSFMSSEFSRDGLRTSGLRQMKRETLQEKQSLLHPFSHFLGIRKQFRKRGGATECFWKYCV